MKKPPVTPATPVSLRGIFTITRSLRSGRKDITPLILIIAGLPLLLIPQTIHAGWSRTYGGENTDIGYCVQETTDGGYIIVGEKDEDLWLLKTDHNGDTLWTRTYAGEGRECAYEIQETKDDCYIIVGEKEGDLWLLKVDPQGDTIWTHTYGGDRKEVGYSVCETTDGGYVITGSTKSFGYEGIWLLKTDPSGDTVWTRTYGSSNDDVGHCVKETNDGGYIVTGEHWFWDYVSMERKTAPKSALYLLKTDSVGDTLWTRAYGGIWWDYGYSLTQASDNGYLIVGQTSSLGLYHLWVLKIDSKGDTLWTQTYGGFKIDEGRCIQETAGGYIITGWTNASNGEGGDLWLLKINSDGDTLWTQTYGGSYGDKGYWAEPTHDGGFILAGYTESSEGQKDIWLLKTDAKGDTLPTFVAEKPIAESETDWHLLSPIGCSIVLQYKDLPQGFHAQVFDATGRRVDEIESPAQNGVLRWGENHSPGVYFIVLTDKEVSVQKVILIE